MLICVPGLTIRIEVAGSYLNKTKGLCGKFSGNNNDDMIGSDGLGKDSLAKMAQSWNEDQDCIVGEPNPDSKCKEVG